MIRETRTKALEGTNTHDKLSFEGNVTVGLIDLNVLKCGTAVVNIAQGGRTPEAM